MRTRRWGIGVALGLGSSAVLLLFLLLLFFSGYFHVGRRLASLVPEPVRDFFTTSRPVDIDTKGLKKTRDALILRFGQLREEARQGSRSVPAVFSVGASKDDVLLIQGPPAEATPNVWKYGKSEIYFLDDRVTSWSNSAEDPLKVR